MYSRGRGFEGRGGFNQGRGNFSRGRGRGDFGGRGRGGGFNRMPPRNQVNPQARDVCQFFPPGNTVPLHSDLKGMMSSYFDVILEDVKGIFDREDGYVMYESDLKSGVAAITATLNPSFSRVVSFTSSESSPGVTNIKAYPSLDLDKLEIWEGSLVESLPDIQAELQDSGTSTCPWFLVYPTGGRVDGMEFREFMDRIPEVPVFVFFMPKSKSIINYEMKDKYSMRQVPFEENMALIYTNETAIAPWLIEKDLEFLREQDAKQEEMEGLLPRIREILRPFLIKVLNKASEADAILDDDAIWKKAFTHSSIQDIDNYEILEFIGDRVLETAFSDYAINKFPGIDQDQLTGLKKYYMSGEGEKLQQKYAEFLRLNELMIYAGSFIEDKILEDLFESFFGAVFTSAETVWNRGEAYSICYDILAYIIEASGGIDFAHSRKDKKSLLVQLVKTDGLENRQSSCGHLYTHTVLMDPERIEWFRRHYSIDIPRVIGSGQGETAKEADKKAYNDAFDHLTRLGVDFRSRKQIETEDKDRTRFNQEDMARLWRAMERHGFDDFEFRAPKSNTKPGMGLVQIVFTDSKDPTHMAFRSIEVPAKSKKEGKTRLIALMPDWLDSRPVTSKKSPKRSKK